MSESSRPLRVGFALYPGNTLIDFAGATQVFAFADGFECVWYAESLDPVLTSENVQVQPACDFEGRLAPGVTLDDPLRMDVLFIPGGGGQGVADAMDAAAMNRFLTAVSPGCQWRGSVCVGAFILWATGILRRCEATTYWSLVPTLETLDVLVPPYFPRFVLDEGRRIFTGGGASSSIDLALELVVRLRGREAAEKAELSIQYAPRPPVDTGDPTLAPPAMVAEMRYNQKGDFIAPIQDAICRLRGDGPA